MDFIYKDSNYKNIIEDILLNREFRKIDNSEHHGTTRFNHSLRVSYISYKLAKALNLNNIGTARGGLLHDFFHTENNRTTSQRVKSVFTHPLVAKENAGKIFNVDNIQADIITSHMFPIGGTVPKYAESWIVNLVDKTVSFYEFSSKYVFKLKPVLTVFVLTLARYL